MNKSKNEINFEPITFITCFVLFFFIVTSIFDISVTITMMLEHQDIFLQQELNPLFVWSRTHNIPLILDPSIWINFATGLFYLQSYFNRKISKRWKMTYLVLTCVLIVFSATHLMGGYSWLVG